MNVKRLEETLVKSEIFLRTPNEKFAVFDAGVCQLGTASSCLAPKPSVASTRVRSLLRLIVEGSCERVRTPFFADNWFIYRVYACNHHGSSGCLVSDSGL
jgi:hypothetical protein